MFSVHLGLSAYVCVHVCMSGGHVHAHVHACGMLGKSG